MAALTTRTHKPHTLSVITNTPEGDAKFKRQFVILKILEQYGLDIHSASDEIPLWSWFYPLHFARTSSIVEEVFQFLVCIRMPFTTLALSEIILCDAGSYIINQIISPGVAVDFTQEDLGNGSEICYTLLQSAVLRGDLVLVKTLAGLTADVNGASLKSFGTALVLACPAPDTERNALDIVGYLISQGAEVNPLSQGPFTRTVLAAAASARNLELASLLLAHGTEVTQQVLDTRCRASSVRY
jgi:hypothetical protein